MQVVLKTGQKQLIAINVCSDLSIVSQTVVMSSSALDKARAHGAATNQVIVRRDVPAFEGRCYGVCIVNQRGMEHPIIFVDCLVED